MSSTTQTSGFVQNEDGSHTVNSSFGKGAAQGGRVSMDNNSWGSSETSESTGPDADSGHNVKANGPWTGSTGNQLVGVVDAPRG